jgi:hypothetical protein
MVEEGFPVNRFKPSRTDFNEEKNECVFGKFRNKATNNSRVQTFRVCACEGKREVPDIR